VNVYPGCNHALIYQRPGVTAAGAVGDAELKHRDLLALIQKYGMYPGERRGGEKKEDS
jgi:hypothetical protein